MSLFLHELKYEQRLYWRSREAAFFTFLFPLLLYVLVSAFYTGKIDGEPAGRVLLAGLLGYAAATTTFAGIAIFLVVRRENGVLKRLRATPLPPPVYIAALLASTLLVFALEAAAMILLARVAYHVGIPDRLGSLVASLLLGAAAFTALGIALTAAIRSAEGASAIVNLIVLPMAFLSGAFGPTRHYPQCPARDRGRPPAHVPDQARPRRDRLRPPDLGLPDRDRRHCGMGAAGARARRPLLSLGTERARLVRCGFGVDGKRGRSPHRFCDALARRARSRGQGQLRHAGGTRGNAGRDRRSGRGAAEGRTAGIHHLGAAARDRPATWKPRCTRSGSSSSTAWSTRTPRRSTRSSVRSSMRPSGGPCIARPPATSTCRTPQRTHIWSNNANQTGLN